MGLYDDLQESAPYETIARAALADVPLTPKQIESILPRLRKDISFITTKTPLSAHSGFWDFRGKIMAAANRLGIDVKIYLEKAALKQPSLFCQSPKTIDKNTTRAAKLLHIDKKTFIEKAALKQPPLFYQSPKTIGKNITRAAKLLHIDKKIYLEMALLKRPQLFCQSPETIDSNITRAASLLGIDKKIYIEKAAMKQPQLFCHSPETIDGNITRAASLLHIDKKTYLEMAALKVPPLFYQLPETIERKITRAAFLLGIDKKIYIEKAALKQPSLFCRSPEAIDGNITRAANLLGIDKKSYIEKAALKQPPLFYQLPETIFKNSLYILAAGGKGYIRNAPLMDAMLDFPAAFGLATRNTHLRAVHAHIVQRSFTLSNFFTGSRRDKKTVEKAVVEHYRDQFNRTGKGVLTLQIMAEAGIISALPDWVPAPETPLRQRAGHAPSPI
ncbi:MAG TPA: hypothetical protein VFS88_05655 [Micavibrio sp.]|nr:hypothetical protein [Micavibrio sp.]